MYVVYILLCSDNSYYTGLTNDLDKRIWQHGTGYFPECYTFTRRPVKLVWLTVVETSEEANKLEQQIKGWSRKKKEALINDNIEELKRLSNYKKKTSEALRQAQGQTEYLIIGQGICGTWLSYYLQKEKRSFLVIDNNHSNSASRIAAGIINPVTGRRIVKTWMIDDLLDFIVPSYKDLGRELAITAIEQENLIDFHPTPQMKIAFEERLNEKADFLFQSPDQEQYRGTFNYDFGCGEVSPCFIVNLKEIIPAWRNKLLAKEQLVEENFEFNELKLTDSSVIYKNIQAKKIIFCDGINSAINPFFKNLPFALNKGEAIIIESPGIPSTHIFKKGMMLTHIENHLYWIGSNYLWEFADDKPSELFRKQTETLLKSWLKVPFKIIDHKASIRPANIERRPFIGFHPLHKSVGILNGMGTKGCSLAPFFAKQLTDHILFQKEILPEADIKRFSKILMR
jgi:predicted GIY-YIG superfamily endonuclease/glycine/D-amino acid oxidase-like deaminating enzyme